MDQIKLLGQGFFWQDTQIGQKFKTFNRTITESDLVSFIGVTGQLEVIFIDVNFPGAIQGKRPVPASLSYCFIEGILMQTMLQQVGLALLEVQQKVIAPVFVGDSIYAEITVKDLKPTSKGNRAVITQVVDIFNQHKAVVLTYEVKRLLAGRDTAHD